MSTVIPDQKMTTGIQQEAPKDLEEQKENSHSPPPVEDHNKSPSPQPAVTAAALKTKDGVDGSVEGQKEDLINKRCMVIKRVLLGLRISGILFCLISFSVMAANKTAQDVDEEFDSLSPFRYCLTVNVIGFLYSGFQTSDLVYYFISGKHAVQYPLRPKFDFVIDQILTYLLLSASSSSAPPIAIWPDVGASVAFSFLAFFAFASSSLLSVYTLCTLKST